MLSPTAETIRLFLHVIAASVWVGGQIVLVGLVPQVRKTHPEAVKTIANGFGKIAWIEPARILFDTAEADGLADRETDIVEHMNADHADALQLYVEHRFGGDAGAGWEMTGIDPEGFDLRRGAARRRIDFDTPVTDVDGARAALVSLAQAARKAG